MHHEGLCLVDGAIAGAARQVSKLQRASLRKPVKARSMPWPIMFHEMVVHQPCRKETFRLLPSGCMDLMWGTHLRVREGWAAPGGSELQE